MRKQRPFTSFGLVLTASLLLGACASYGVRMACAEETHAGSTASRHLLIDARLVDKVENAELSLGHVQKSSSNPLFGEDKPWEPRYDNMYPNVIFDREDDMYKCWYTPFVISELDEKTPREKRATIKWNVSNRHFALCYATSKDGLKWEKPDLGIVELRGSNTNNILLMDVHGADVIKDERETNPARRYKMFGTLEGLGPHMVWFSADGLHWGEPITLNLGGRSDTHNNVFWSPQKKEFVAITRSGFVPRSVGRTSSTDFVHWSPVQEVMKPIVGQPDIHDMVVFPYEGIYLGLMGVYDVAAGRQWTELAWSPDTIQWHQIKPGTPFIPNSAKEGDYDWGCIFATRPIVGKDEIRIYYAGCNGKFFDWRDGFLCLATLPQDRWAGYENTNKTAGTILTQPVVCCSGALAVTADAKGGRITIDLLDEGGKELATSEAVTGNVTDKPVQWKANFDQQKVVGKQVRIRFKIEDATAYSFSFIPK